MNVTIAPNAGLANQSQYGGYVVLTPQGGGKTYRVPYAGFVGDYQTVPVLTPTPNGFPWLAKLNAAVVAALATPAVAERLTGVGVDPAPSTPDALEDWIKQDIERYRRIIALTGAKPEGR